MDSLRDTTRDGELLDAGQWTALAPRPGETARAHTAFLDYVRQGPGRSVRTLCARYRVQTEGEPRAEKPPTTRLATLFEWSTRHAWQERLAAFKDERDAHDQEVWEARRRQVREQDWGTGEELRELVARILAEAPQFLKSTRRVVKGHGGQPDREIITVGIQIDAMLKAVDLASKLQRQAAEVLPPVQRHEVYERDVPFTADELARGRALALQTEQELLSDDDGSDGDGDTDV